MLACNKANKLYKEWKSDQWANTDSKDHNMYFTLKILMDDMYRVLKEYERVNTPSKLHTLITKYKKASEYFDNYKYQSMLAGIKHGPITK
jgi:hypothetical protein